jgi:putative tryptophan/tyrosine transport system substrate-binding protein
MIVMTDNFTTAHRVEITSLPERYRLPTVYPYRFFVDLGGLLSYGSDTPDDFRRAAGITSSVSVTSSPSLDSRDPPQQPQATGPGTITRSRGR